MGKNSVANNTKNNFTLNILIELMVCIGIDMQYFFLILRTHHTCNRLCITECHHSN